MLENIKFPHRPFKQGRQTFLSVIGEVILLSSLLEARALDSLCWYPREAETEKRTALQVRRSDSRSLKDRCDDRRSCRGKREQINATRDF